MKSLQRLKKPKQITLIRIKMILWRFYPVNFSLRIQIESFKGQKLHYSVKWQTQTLLVSWLCAWLKVNILTVLLLSAFCWILYQWRHMISILKADVNMNQRTVTVIGKICLFGINFWKKVARFLCTFLLQKLYWKSLPWGSTKETKPIWKTHGIFWIFSLWLLV